MSIRDLQLRHLIVTVLLTGATTSVQAAPDNSDADPSRDRGRIPHTNQDSVGPDKPDPEMHTNQDGMSSPDKPRRPNEPPTEPMDPPEEPTPWGPIDIGLQDLGRPEVGPILDLFAGKGTGPMDFGAGSPTTSLPGIEIPPEPIDPFGSFVTPRSKPIRSAGGKIVASPIPGPGSFGLFAVVLLARSGRRRRG